LSIRKFINPSISFICNQLFGPARRFPQDDPALRAADELD
jgi:hypothetical protein